MITTINSLKNIFLTSSLRTVINFWGLLLLLSICTMQLYPLRYCILISRSLFTLIKLPSAMQFIGALIDCIAGFCDHAYHTWIIRLQMLFLWSKKPVPNPRASPWFAWFTTAVLLWRCRRRITRAILAVSPLRLLRRRTSVRLTLNQQVPSAIMLKQRKRHRLALHKNAGIRRAKRLCTGDGPHVSNSISSILQAAPQIHYRVTRSGRVYGKYPNKAAIANGGIQESRWCRAGIIKPAEHRPCPYINLVIACDRHRVVVDVIP